MIAPADFLALLQRAGFDFFTGVPDSLLKDFCACIADNTGQERHVIAANEGNAIGLAIGHFLATAKPALVYMQNSGIGNAINPLLSLADAEVYGIPMLLVVGWRGERGCHDEPQHVKQGRIMTELLDAMEIPWLILDARSNPARLIDEATALLADRKAPVVLLVRNGTFAPHRLSRPQGAAFPLSREMAIRRIVDRLNPADIVVCTTGMASRELYEYRALLGSGQAQDFLTVGGMGHASSIALGIALERKSQRVLCIDGDGATIMHMGSLTTIGQSNTENFVHLVINNGAHDSVGGQPTAALAIDLPSIAKACGYRWALSVDNQKSLDESLSAVAHIRGPAFIEVRVRTGNRPSLGRPKSSPQQNRDAFMRQLQRT